MLGGTSLNGTAVGGTSGACHTIGIFAAKLAVAMGNERLQGRLPGGPGSD